MILFLRGFQCGCSYVLIVKIQKGYTVYVIFKGCDNEAILVKKAKPIVAIKGHHCRCRYCGPLASLDSLPCRLTCGRHCNHWRRRFPISIVIIRVHLEF